MSESAPSCAWVTPHLPLLRPSRALPLRSSRVPSSRRAPRQPAPVANAQRSPAAPPHPSQQQQQQHASASVHDTTDPTVAFENFEHWPQPQTVPISGHIPPYLHEHVYYRVGPARFEERHKDGVVWKAQQLFDGISKVASFQFDVTNRTVTFRSRFNSTRLIDKIQNTPSTTYRTLSISRSPNTVWQQLKQWRIPTLDPEINLPYANYVASVEDIPGMGLCARTDNAIGQIIHPQTLQPVRQFRFKELHPKLSGFGSLAHGMSDKSSGDYFNVVWDYFPGKVKYHVFRTNKHGRTDILASFRENAYYAHEACITENYIVSVLVPTGINFFYLVLFMCLGNAIEIPDDKDVKFVVVSRKHGGVVRTFTHSFFSFTHCVNAFERDDDIVIDLCRVPKMEDIISSDLEDAKSKGALKDLPLVRYTLPNVSSESDDSAPSRAISKTIVDVLGEFPSISSKYARKPYRYTYVVGIKEDVMAGSIRKFDLHTGEMSSFAVPGCVLGEPFFVPDPQGESEDDGCVVVVALDTVERKSIVLVLDAKRFVEVARAKLPVAISTGFHGYMRKAAAVGT